MAQRQFVLTFTMGTDAAATSRDGSDPEMPCIRSNSAALGGSSRGMRGLPLLKLRGTKG